MRIVVMALAAMLATSAAQAASIETYSKLPSMRMVSISPDGSKVAFVQIVKGQQAVVIDQLNPAGLVGNIPPDTHTVQSMTWVDSNHLIVVRSEAAIAGKGGQPPISGAVVVDLEKRKISPLINKSELAIFNGGIKVRKRDGKTIVVVPGSSWLNGTPVPTLETVDFATGDETRAARAHTNQFAEWGIDATGKLEYQTIYDQLSHVWTLQLPQGSGWVDGYSVKALLDPPRVVGRTLDGKSLVLQQYSEDHGLEFRSVSLPDGKLGDLVPEYAGLNNVIYDPQTFLPIGGVKEGLEPNYVFFDPKDQALWEGIVKVFPDEEVTLTSWSQDRSKAVVQVTGVRHGVSYQVVDTATHKAVGIGSAFEGLTGNDLADVQIATYPTKDGQKIQALLTLPIGRDAKNLPLIVMPHSGPALHDQTGYAPGAQAFASLGYAVLQPQYRGSSGLGWKLEEAGFGEFGRKMQTDLSDGVKALASAGIIDAKRVCIVGDPGYAGYAALAGVMFEQGVYRCAVAIDPWTDMKKAAGVEQRGVPDANAQRSIQLRNWERLVGAKDPSAPVYDQISPAKHAADASAPILVINERVGGDDAVNMVNALHAAKKDAELLPLNSFDPDALEKRRADELKAMVAFVEKNNPPK